MDELRTRLAHEFGKPVIGVPNGSTFEGRLVRLEPSDHVGKLRAIVVGEQAVHAISIAPEARALIGKQVAIQNLGGALSVQPAARQPELCR